MVPQAAAAPSVYQARWNWGKITVSDQKQLATLWADRFRGAVVLHAGRAAEHQGSPHRIMRSGAVCTCANEAGADRRVKLI